MNRLTLMLAIAIVTTTSTVIVRGGTRAARPEFPLPAKHARFDPAQSVALFVGASTFSDDDTLESVPYAVDDAVDLAYAFALDPRVALVPPKRVVLALSEAAPRKSISQRRLAELRRRGATIVPATQSQILKLLSQQAGAVGADGIFIVSFASHGFSHDGLQYLLASNSLFREFQTAIPAARVLDLVAMSRATRSLILIDTCRERVQRWQRSAAPERLSAAPLIRQMASTAGQVVLYAAAAGKWAYDDDMRQNGVFTSAILDGLQCRSGFDHRGMVTVDELSTKVEQRVLTWIRTNRDPSLRTATQVNAEGTARMMPLAVCSRAAPVDPPPVESLDLTLPPQAKGAPLRPLLMQCRDDGATLGRLYGSQKDADFVTAYLRWRDGCVAVLRDLDHRLPPQRRPEDRETTRFLSVANFWCTTQCPDALSAGNCALFRETPRAERCSWDLDKALKQVDDILVRNPIALQAIGPAQGDKP